MKKLIIPAVLITALLISSCGKGKDANTPSPSPSALPKPTFLLLGETPSSAVNGGENNTDNPDSSVQEGGNSNTVSNSGESDSNGQADSVSIINGSSTAFYAVYLTTSTGGNPGENIIGDTPLSEGEEIMLPFANAPSESLTIIVEDENGIQYSAGGVSLANGLTIELYLNDGVLEAVVY